MKKAKFLLRLMILTGILIIFGTAGASDLERINLADCVSQIMIGGGLILSGKAGLNFLKAARLTRRKKAHQGKPKTALLGHANAA